MFKKNPLKKPENIKAKAAVKSGTTPAAPTGSTKKVPAKAAVEKKIPVKKAKKEKTSLWWKDLILAVFNLVLIVGAVVILGKLPSRALEFKALRNAELQLTTKSSFDIAELEIESSSQKADRLLVLFPDEPGLVEFVKEIDTLKEEGIVTRFFFASEKAVRDKTGYYGIPLVIEFSGTWDQIGLAIQIIDDLPYLLRAVTVDAEPEPDTGLIIFKYGGFLYVDESLAKN